MKIKSKILFGLSFLAISCHKAVYSPHIAAGALNVTNAVVGGGTLTLGTSFNIASGSNMVSNNAAATFPLAGGQNQVNLFIAAVAATATTPAIPQVNYYSNNFNVDNTTYYSLFLSGTSPSQIDTVLIKESFPYAYKDSICGVRFINLSPDSNPLSVNIKGNANGSEISSLGYKAYSDFKQYSANSLNKSYIFEFRDATTGNLITSYTLTTPFFHNVTLALRGVAGGPNGVILDNDY